MSERLDYEAQMNLVLVLIRAAADLAVDPDALERAHSLAETLGPILEPTAYARGGGNNLYDQAKVLSLALPFIRGARHLVESYRAKAPGGDR